MKKTFILVVFITAILIAGVWLSKLLQKKAELTRPGQILSSQGQQHIQTDATHEAYNSNPPTSGSHNAQPANWGIYQSELLDENLIHNLEHGGIWISYNDIDSDTKTKIENLAKKYPNKMIVTPRSKNDSKIALASWTRLLKLDVFDEAVIVDFIKANKNKSPEPNAQ